MSVSCLKFVETFYNSGEIIHSKQTCYFSVISIYGFNFAPAKKGYSLLGVIKACSISATSVFVLRHAHLRINASTMNHGKI